MQTRERKRPRTSYKSAGQNSSVSVVTASNGLRVSAAQLRELWCHDNECGRKYMKGCPLRTCLALDGLSCGEGEGEGQGLTSQEFELLKIRIGEMWRIASTLFEVFIQKGAELEGYRLRVRTDKPLNVSIKPLEAIEFGWIAQIPKELALAHVFNRSALEPNGYLGGPVSYMNWCETKKQKVAVITCESHSMCRIYLSGSHGPGKELKWDYGLTEMPILHDWFLPECCQLSTVDPIEKKRHEKYSKRIHWFTESCVLCGELFSIANKEFRVQRKQHFIGKHANFLGSLWDGCGSYDLEKVSRDTLLYMAEKLNHFLNELKTMNWGVLPACKVFNEEEMELFEKDPEGLKHELCKRKEMFKRAGVLILRGLDVPSTFEHFKPIEPLRWRLIAWEKNMKPTPGRYAVAPEVKREIEALTPSFLSTFFEKYMEIS